MFSGMANSVDPDQTLLQEQSDLGLHCLHMLFCQKTSVYEILGHFQYVACSESLMPCGGKGPFLNCISYKVEKQITFSATVLSLSRSAWISGQSDQIMNTNVLQVHITFIWTTTFIPVLVGLSNVL